MKKNIYYALIACMLALLSCGNLINEEALGDGNTGYDPASGIKLTTFDRSYSLSGEIRIEKVYDTGYYIAGSVAGDSSEDTDNLWFTLIDKNGGSLNEGVLGSDYDDRVRIVKVLDDNNVIFCADRYYADGDSDFIIVKYNRYAGVLWDYCFGNDKKNRVFDVTKTPDGETVLTGMSYYKNPTGMVYVTFIMKIDENGNLAWEKNYKSLCSVFMPYEIHKAGTDNYIVSGLCLDSGTKKFRTFFARLDSGGNLLSSMYINAVNEHSMLVGSSLRVDGGVTAVIALVSNTDSDILAVVSFGGDMSIKSIKEFSFPDLNVRGKFIRGEYGDIIIAGMLNSTAGNGLYFLRFTSDGVIKSLNTKVYDSSVYDIYDVSFGSAEDDNGIIYTCRYSNSDYSSDDGRIFMDSFRYNQSTKAFPGETLITRDVILNTESPEYETGDFVLNSDSILVEEKGGADLILFTE